MQYITKLISLLDLPSGVTEESRKKKLLNIIFVSVLIAALVSMVYYLLIPTADLVAEISVIPFDLVIIAVTLFFIFLTKKIPAKLTGLLFLIIFSAIILASDTPAFLANGRSTYLLTIPVYLSSTLLFPQASFIFYGLSIISIFVLSHLAGNIPVNPTTIAGLFVIAVFAWLSPRSNQQANKELDEEVAKDTAILESIGEGILATDSTGKVTYLNEEGERLLGWQEAEIKDHPADQYLKVANHQKIPIKIFSDQKINTQSLESSYYLTQRNGFQIPINFTATPITIKQQINGTIFVFRDVSNEKKTDQAKSDFINLASHQLRTPLSSIKWNSEIILSGEAGKVDQSILVYVSEINRSTNRAVTLVNNLLTVTNIEAGNLKLHPQPQNLSKITNEIVAQYKLSLEKKKLTLSAVCDSSLTLSIDPDALTTIIKSLLSNAIEYSHDGDQISLKIALQDSVLQITVSDHGLGIPFSDQPKVFSKLFRSDTARNTYPDGKGLELYITKSLVDLLGGQIKFDSEENKGTTFTVSLPPAGQA